MKDWLRWVFLSLIGAIGVLAVVILILYIIALLRLSRNFEIQDENFTIPADSLALERGHHLVVAITGCTICHGQSLQGQAYIDSTMVGLIYAPNLTSGQGGIGNSYSEADWEQAIRHGVNPDGEPLLMMPSHHYANLSDTDLVAMIAYLKSVPPVDSVSPESRMALPAYILFAAGGLGQLAAEQVDHTSDHPAPEPGLSVQYGEYLANVAMCKDCHGQDLRGGQTSPEDPPAPDITISGDLSAWLESDFLTLMRYGKKPYDKQIDPAMPWQNYQDMTDEELAAIWLYLQSLPAE